MHVSRQIDVLGSKAREDVLDKFEAFGGRPMLDENLGTVLVFVSPIITKHTNGWPLVSTFGP
jgi:hypothetical protein